MWSHRISYHIASYVVINVSEEPAASLFRIRVILVNTDQRIELYRKSNFLLLHSSVQGQRESVFAERNVILRYEVCICHRSLISYYDRSHTLRSLGRVLSSIARIL